jgi:FdhE protein
MAGGFIHRLFNTPATVSAEGKEVLAELKRLAQEHPELARSAALLSELLPKLYQDPIQDPPPELAPEHAAAKLSAGIPLLRGEDLDLDIKAFGRRWFDICAAVGRHQSDSDGQRMALALRNGRLNALELTQETLAGRPETIYAKADLLGLDAALFATVLRLTLFPLLAHFEAVLAPLRNGVRWHQGYCPTCGSWPLLGEFRGLDQTRFLRCGLCAAQWEFPRLLCPFCGTSDHHLLGYLHVEGEELKYRAATCDACRGYVKTVSTLSALPGPELLVVELATMHLDLAAAERNYVAQP